MCFTREKQIIFEKIAIQTLQMFRLSEFLHFVRKISGCPTGYSLCLSGQVLSFNGMSSDDGTFGADGVAQAGHELHIPLAEPGVCGLAVDEQLEASGTVRVALQADLRIRDVEAARILRSAELARDVEGFMAMISRAPTPGFPCRGSIRPSG